MTTEGLPSGLFPFDCFASIKHTGPAEDVVRSLKRRKATARVSVNRFLNRTCDRPDDHNDSVTSTTHSVNDILHFITCTRSAKIRIPQNISVYNPNRNSAIFESNESNNHEQGLP